MDYAEAKTSVRRANGYQKGRVGDHRERDPTFDDRFFGPIFIGAIT